MSCGCRKNEPTFKRYLRDGFMAHYGYCLELSYACEHSLKPVNWAVVPSTTGQDTTQMRQMGGIRWTPA